MEQFAITYRSNSGDGSPQALLVDADTTVGDLIAENESRDIADYTVRVNGAKADAFTTLKSGDTVSVTPNKFQGN